MDAQRAAYSTQAAHARRHGRAHYRCFRRLLRGLASHRGQGGGRTASPDPFTRERQELMRRMLFALALLSLSAVEAVGEPFTQCVVFDSGSIAKAIAAVRRGDIKGQFVEGD